MKMECKSCKWWMKYSNRKNTGQCRKNTPTCLLSGGFCWFSVDEKGHWPGTKEHQWCGEFEAKEVKK